MEILYIERPGLFYRFAVTLFGYILPPGFAPARRLTGAAIQIASLRDELRMRRLTTKNLVEP